MKRENKYEELERELMSDDGIFCIKQRTVFENLEKCACCGFELLPGEEALQLYSSGDVIHRNCWSEYAEENPGYFGKDFTVGDGDCIDFGRGEL